jgi:hypothetical protein
VTLLVYGRKEYSEPLVELGTATDDADVRTAYGGGEWVELVALPAEAVHWIIRDGERVDDD